MRLKHTNNKNIYWRFEIDFLGWKNNRIAGKSAGTRGASVNTRDLSVEISLKKCVVHALYIKPIKPHFVTPVAIYFFSPSVIGFFSPCKTKKKITLIFLGFSVGNGRKIKDLLVACKDEKGYGSDLGVKVMLVSCGGWFSYVVELLGWFGWKNGREIGLFFIS